MFTKKDFQNLQFNALSELELLKEYAALKEIVRAEILDEPELDKLLRYTIMICEPKSVLVLSERDLNFRKSMAADLAGLPKDEEYRQEVYCYTNEIALELTIKYLTRFAKSKEYAAIVALENSYWENIKLLLKPIDDTNGVKDKDILDAVQKKSAIKSEIDADLKRIENYYSSFFGEDKELINKKERITPENVRKLKK
jgi:hypothetical protein